MEKFKDKYRIESARMPGWDYSRGGKYCITICTKNRICCFGDVTDGKMGLNDMGKIANDLWLEIPEHFDDTYLDEHIVMPNHIHGIVVIKRSHKMKNLEHLEHSVHSEHSERLECLECLECLERRDAINGVSTYHNGVSTYQFPNQTPSQQQHNNPNNTDNNTYSNGKEPETKISKKQSGGITGIHNPMLSDDSLGKIIRWFKGRCTYEFGKLGHGEWFSWQARYHDSIIRNDSELHIKRQYIKNNPKNWQNDKYNNKIIKNH